MAITVTITDDTWAAIQAAAADIASGASARPSSSGSAPGGTASTPSGTTTQSPPPAPTQTYPLTMPSGITNGAPVTLGTGPNSISLYASNNPGSSVKNQFIVIVEQGAKQTAVAGPLTVTATSGMVMKGSQNFVVNGDFPGITGVSIVGAGAGLNGLWIDQLSVDLIPWKVNADAANSRGTGKPSYQESVFDSNGSNMTFLPPSAIPAAPTPAPAPALTSISGAAVEGASHAAATLAALIKATAAGQTLALPAGTIVGTAPIATACTVSGAGMGKTVIDATGLQPYSNKAVLVPNVKGVTISDLTIQGASIPASLGNNAAGVREGGPGMPFTLSNVEITGCQDGILTFGDDVTLTGGHTHDNGAGDGYTHEIYLGGDTTNTVTLTNWTSECGTKSTHALKSRAGTTKVSSGTFTGSADSTGNVGGSVVDIPDGGVVEMTGATLVVSAGAANTLFLGYGMESAKNSSIGTTVTLKNVVFADHSGSGGQIQAGSAIPNASLVLEGCTYTGTKAPQILGFANVSGSIAKG